MPAGANTDDADADADAEVLETEGAEDEAGRPDDELDGEATAAEIMTEVGRETEARACGVPPEAMSRRSRMGLSGDSNALVMVGYLMASHQPNLRPRRKDY